MSGSRFNVDVTRTPEQTTVRLRGELEDASAAEARAAFEQALASEEGRLVIDFTELEFMDSTGIWLIVETHRRCVEAGIDLTLGGSRRPAVAHALDLSGIEELVSAPAGSESPPGEQVSLRLYLSSQSATGAAAASSVRSLATRFPSTPVDIEVIDVFECPGRAEEDRVIATPTLIKVKPAPELRLIGAVADPDAIVRHLGLAHLAGDGHPPA